MLVLVNKCIYFKVIIIWLTWLLNSFSHADGFLYTLDMMEYTATEDNRAVLVCMVCTSLVSEQPSATTVTVMLSTADGTAVGE